MTQLVISNPDVWAISPRQLIDLDVSNFEFRISNICCLFYRQMQWKKIKINIQNSTLKIDELPGTKCNGVVG